MNQPDQRLCDPANVAAKLYLSRALSVIDFEPDRARLLLSAHKDIAQAVCDSLSAGNGPDDMPDIEKLD